MNKNSDANETSQRKAVPFPPILFDLDGTLVDSAYQHVLAWHETFTDFRMFFPATPHARNRSLHKSRRHHAT
jgi:beta-phosphoglucomutase-like phosphatase (HAD superfamily)